MTMTDVVRINTFGSALHVPGSGAPHRCREVPPATLLLGGEIPTRLIGDPCLVFSG